MLKFQIWKILPLILIITAGLFATPAQADPFILPKIDGAGPTIDGNIAAAEWQDFLLFNATVNNQDAQIRVSSDDNNLYIGFNFTAPNFVPVDDNGFNATITENLDTHDWVVFQFDNNLDQKPMGTADSPDDAVIFDQYTNTAVDALINGTSYITDIDNEGNADGTYAFANVTDALTYEISKPLSSGDLNGSDIAIERSILQFRINNFFNQTSNSSSYSSTQWFTFRVNETGTGVAYKSVSNTTISLSIVSDDSSKYTGLSTVLDQYGFDVTTSIGNLTFGDVDLNIIVIDETSSVDDNNLDELVTYIELGGKVIIFLAEGSGDSSKIAEKFNLEYLSESVKSPDNETMLTFSSTGFNSSLRYITANTNVTDRVIKDVGFTSGAFNKSSLFDSKYMFRQEYHMQDIFNIDNFLYSNDTVNSNITIGASIDLMKTGRVSIFAGNSIVTNEFINYGDNMHLLLRMMPWNARLVNTLKINSVEIDDHAVNKTEPIKITINVTNGFDEYNADINVKAMLVRNDQAVFTLDLSSTTSVYEGVIETNVYGNMQIEVLAYLDGYGYAEGEIQQVFIDTQLNLYNSFSDISTLIMGIFVLSVFITVFTIIKSKE